MVRGRVWEDGLLETMAVFSSSKVEFVITVVWVRFPEIRLQWALSSELKGMYAVGNGGRSLYFTVLKSIWCLDGSGIAQLSV